MKFYKEGWDLKINQKATIHVLFLNCAMHGRFFLYFCICNRCSWQKIKPLITFELQIFGFRGNRYTNCVTTTAHNSTLCLVHFFPSGFCIKYKYKWTTKSFPPLCSDFQTSVKCTLSFDFCKISWNRFGHNSINLNDTKNLFDWLKFSQIFEQRSSFLTTSVA